LVSLTDVSVTRYTLPTKVHGPSSSASKGLTKTIPVRKKIIMSMIIVVFFVSKLKKRKMIKSAINIV
jgi:hypothetical protein